MSSKTPHNQEGKPLCPLCGTTSVSEIYPQDDPRHRHVCLNPKCPQISSNKQRRAAGLPVLYPDIEEDMRV